MACGVPAVTTSVSGIPELVDDGVTGLIVPVNDPAHGGRDRAPGPRSGAGASGCGERGGPGARTFRRRRLAADSGRACSGRRSHERARPDLVPRARRGLWPDLRADRRPHDRGVVCSFRMLAIEAAARGPVAAQDASSITSSSRPLPAGVRCSSPDTSPASWSRWRWHSSRSRVAARRRSARGDAERAPARAARRRDSRPHARRTCRRCRRRFERRTAAASW